VCELAEHGVGAETHLGTGFDPPDPWFDTHPAAARTPERAPELEERHVVFAAAARTGN